MNSIMTRQTIGMHVLRLGLSAIFLWFGFSQIIDSLNWVSSVPDWAVNFLHIPPAMIVMGNGAFEIVLGSLMAMGFFVRTISLILALHLIPITVDFGLVATGVRDFGIIIASLSLSFIYTKNSSPALPPQVSRNF
jgi:uncharacterized membrane protein YphA (DoxX/SURF4 family)